MPESINNPEQNRESDPSSYSGTLRELESDLRIIIQDKETTRRAQGLKEVELPEGYSASFDEATMFDGDIDDHRTLHATFLDEQNKPDALEKPYHLMVYEYKLPMRQIRTEDVFDDGEIIRSYKVSRDGTVTITVQNRLGQTSTDELPRTLTDDQPATKEEVTQLYNWVHHVVSDLPSSIAYYRGERN